MSNVSRINGEVKHISADKSEGTLIEEGTLSERRFTNPVAIDINAGNHGVFIKIQPPEGDPVVVLHKNNS